MSDNILSQDLHARLDGFLSSNDNFSIEKSHLRCLIRSEQARFAKAFEPSPAEVDRKLAKINVIRDRFLSDQNQKLRENKRRGFYKFLLAVLINMSEAELQRLATEPLEDINLFLDDCYPFIRHRESLLDHPRILGNEIYFSY